MSIVPLPGVISTWTPASPAIWPAHAPAALHDELDPDLGLLPSRSLRSVAATIRPPVTSNPMTRW